MATKFIPARIEVVDIGAHADDPRRLMLVSDGATAWVEIVDADGAPVSPLDSGGSPAASPFELTITSAKPLVEYFTDAGYGQDHDELVQGWPDDACGAIIRVSSGDVSFNYGAVIANNVSSAGDFPPTTDSPNKILQDEVLYSGRCPR